MENQETTTEVNTAPPSLVEQPTETTQPVEVKSTWQDDLIIVEKAFTNLRNTVNALVPGNRDKSITITELETAEWRAIRAFSHLKNQAELQAQKQN